MRAIASLAQSIMWAMACMFVLELPLLLCVQLALADFREREGL